MTEGSRLGQFSANEHCVVGGWFANRFGRGIVLVDFGPVGDVATVSTHQCCPAASDGYGRGSISLPQ